MCQMARAVSHFSYVVTATTRADTSASPSRPADVQREVVQAVEERVKARLHRRERNAFEEGGHPAHWSAKPFASYGTAATGTMCLTFLALPRMSPLRTFTGTGGVSLKR